METIAWEDFEKVELRGGRIVKAKSFPEARDPAYVLRADFREEIGVRTSSAQITDYYESEGLEGRLVVGVVNLLPKQIDPVRSECLVTGFYDEDGRMALCVPDRPVPLGARLL